MLKKQQLSLDLLVTLKYLSYKIKKKQYSFLFINVIFK